MRTVGSFEAKTHLAALLEEVARGERVTITRHGVPVAMLVPVGPASKANRQELVQQIRQLRRGNRLGRLTLRKLIEEGRRV